MGPLCRPNIWTYHVGPPGGQSQAAVPRGPILCPISYGRTTWAHFLSNPMRSYHVGPFHVQSHVDVPCGPSLWLIPHRRTTWTDREEARRHGADTTLKHCTGIGHVRTPRREHTTWIDHVFGPLAHIMWAPMWTHHMDTPRGYTMRTHHVDIPRRCVAVDELLGHCVVTPHGAAHGLAP